VWERGEISGETDGERGAEWVKRDRESEDIKW
jgi:hypothetical protein